MKGKRIFLVMVVACFAVTLLATNCFAAYATYNCQVLRAGPTGTEVYVMLSDVGGSFSSEWFRVDTTMGKEILATCLTAMNMGNQIEAKIDRGAGLIKGAKLTLNAAP